MQKSHVHAIYWVVLLVIFVFWAAAIIMDSDDIVGKWARLVAAVAFGIFAIFYLAKVGDPFASVGYGVLAVWVYFNPMRAINPWYEIISMLVAAAIIMLYALVRLIYFSVHHNGHKKIRHVWIEQLDAARPQRQPQH